MEVELRGNGAKSVLPVNVLAILLLKNDAEPFQVLHMYGGFVVDGERRRILTPLVTADVDGNRFVDIVLLDSCYAGEMQKIHYNQGSALKVENIHSNAWD